MKTKRSFTFFKSYLRLKTIWIVVLWILANFAAFWITFWTYARNLEFYYLRQVLGVSLFISRSSATLILLNTLLIIITRCKYLIDVIYHLFNVFGVNVVYDYLLNSSRVHSTLGYIIFICSIIHVSSHLVNCIHFSYHYDPNLEELFWNSNTTYTFVYDSFTGISGLVMLTILCILVLTSIDKIRQAHYNTFWYTHTIVYIFIILSVFHPISRVLKQQSNVDEHVPGCRRNSTAICKDDPKFTSINSNGRTYLLICFGIFIVDILYRKIRRYFQRSYVLDVERVYNATKFTLKLPYERFKINPGEVVFLQFRNVSRLEWHPFTVICFEPRKYFQVLIKPVGDWTEKLVQKSHVIQIENKSRPMVTLSPVNIDGPYCTQMEHVLKMEEVVCIAAGVGISGFMMSFHALLKQELTLPIRIQLIWVMRDEDCVEYCEDLLIKLHDKFWNNNEPDRFTFEIYVTKNSKATGTRSDNLISNRITRGRPKWSLLFKKFEENNRNKICDIFVVGPERMTTHIYKWCNFMNLKNRVHFRLNCEV